MSARLVQIENGRRIGSTPIEGPLIVGRDPSADLVIDHARVSRHHVRFEPHDEGVSLTDLGSSNGTRLNGYEVTSPVVVEHGDVIELGDAIELVYEEGAGWRPALLGGAGALLLALAVGVGIWLWPTGDPVMREALELARAGVEAQRSGEPLVAKKQLFAAVDLLVEKGRLNDAPRNRVHHVGLERLGQELGGVDLARVLREALDDARAARSAPVQTVARGPCRLSAIPEDQIDLCIRERAEQVLYDLWQDPEKIPERFYDAVNQQARMLLRRRDWVLAALERGEPYIPMMQRELEAQKMPPLLHYLSMIESGYDRQIKSPAGARGLWQFMPATARQFGLEVSAARDDRTDPEKSTKAAAHYLNNLAFEFGGDALLLAIASYNKGENGVRRALKRLDDPRTDRSYWTLVERDFLPQETQDYVPRFVAAAVLGEAGLPPTSGMPAR